MKSNISYEETIYVISKLFVVPLIMIAPFATFMSVPVEKNSKPNEFVMFNFIGMLYSLILVAWIGIMVIMIQSCIGNLIVCAPTLLVQVKTKTTEKNKQHDEPQIYNINILETLHLLCNPFIIIFGCALTSEMIYHNAGLSKFTSVFVGNSTFLAGITSIYVVYNKIIYPQFLRLCIYLITHNAECRKFAQSCVELYGENNTDD